MEIGNEVKQEIIQNQKTTSCFGCFNCDRFLQTHMKIWCEHFSKESDVPTKISIQHRLDKEETITMICNLFEEIIDEKNRRIR